MAVNKVVLGERTLIDLSLDTATEADVAKGKYFHRADGELAIGKHEDSGGGSGSGAAGGSAEKGVNFYDYDGTLLHSYTVEEAQSLTELPEAPAHDGLVFQEWNWTLDEIKEYNEDVNIGATYITDDGKTRLYITLDDMSQAFVQLYFSVSIEGDTLVINWGDGTGDETHDIEAYSDNTKYQGNPRLFGHTYENVGDYVITVGSGKKLKLGYYYYSLLYQAEPSTNTDSGRRISGNRILTRLEMGNIEGLHAAFAKWCVNLKSVTIPSGAKYWDHREMSDRSLFGHCYALGSVIFPRGFFNGNFFDLCDYAYGLKRALFPGNTNCADVKNIFRYCYNLETITIPRGMTGWGDYAFKDTGVKKIVAPSVTYVGNYVFDGCRSLKEVAIPSATSIGNYAFNNCSGLVRIDMPINLNSIGGYAFQYCYSLKEIRIPQGVKNIGSATFQYCYSLEEIELPDSVTNFGTFAFANCRSLCRLKIPDGVTSLPNSFANSCYSLLEVEVGSNVASIGSNVFASCFALKVIDFSRHTAVPTLSNSSAIPSTNADLEIRVPAALYDEWIAATNWSNSAIKNKIVAV